MAKDNNDSYLKGKPLSRRNILKAGVGGSTFALTGMAGCLGDDDDGMTVFFMIPAADVPRWEERDLPAFRDEINRERPNWEVESRDAGDSQSTQLSQVEDAITQGADAFTMIPPVPSDAGGALETAANDDVPVVLYERGGFGGPAAARVAYDAFASGVAEAEAALEVVDRLLQDRDTVSMIRLWGIQGSDWGEDIRDGQDEVLQPYIDDGRIEVLEGDYVGWGEDDARTFVEDSLTRFGDDVDMILASNDATANGAAQALISQGIEPGEVPIAGGQDADIEGVQLILQGWLHATYYKSLDVLGEVAAQLTIAAAEGDDMPDEHINTTYDNDFMEMPMAALEGQNLTEEDIDILVEEDVYTWEQMCQGIEDTSRCQENL